MTEKTKPVAYNKAALAEELAAKSGEITSKAQAARIIDLTFELLQAGLKKNGLVVIPEFGSFTMKERAARKGRNPATGDIIKIAAKKVVAFKPRGELKTAIAKKTRAPKK